jgi:hypothetical protein
MGDGQETRMLEFDPLNSNDVRVAFRWRPESTQRAMPTFAAILSLLFGLGFLGMSIDLVQPVQVPPNAERWHAMLACFGFAFLFGAGRLASALIARQWEVRAMVFDRERGVVELAESRKGVDLRGALSYGELKDAVVRSVSSGAKARATLHHVNVRRVDGGRLPVASFPDSARAREIATRIEQSLSGSAGHGDTDLPSTGAFTSTRTADGAVVTWPLRGSRANALLSTAFRGLLGAGLTVLLMSISPPIGWAAAAATLFIAGRRLLVGLHGALGEGRLEIRKDRVIGGSRGVLPTKSQEIPAAEVAAVQVRHARSGHTALMFLRAEELALAEEAEANPADRVAQPGRYRALRDVMSVPGGGLALLELLQLEEEVERLLQEIAGVEAL